MTSASIPCAGTRLTSQWSVRRLDCTFGHTLVICVCASLSASAPQVHHPPLAPQSFDRFAAHAFARLGPAHAIVIHMSASCEAPDGQASAGAFTRSADDLAPAPSTTPLRSRSRWAEYACCRAQSRGSLAFRTSEQQADGAQLAADAEQHKHDEVLDLTRRFVEHDSHVTFMLDKLKEAGCPFPKDRIVVARCDRPVSGFFSTENHGLTLCYDNYQGRPAVLRNTLVHELVHAYDQCRGRDVDFLNCKHLACTEVRAARLSGDCSMSMESQRSHLPLPGYEKACVKRRAQLSLSMLPHCKLTAAAHVLGVLDECYQDTEPFARPP